MRTLLTTNMQQERRNKKKKKKKLTYDDRGRLGHRLPIRIRHVFHLVRLYDTDLLSDGLFTSAISDALAVAKGREVDSPLR
jgi:hypothetical protein